MRHITLGQQQNPCVRNPYRNIILSLEICDVIIKIKLMPWWYRQACVCALCRESDTTKKSRWGNETLRVDFRGHDNLMGFEVITTKFSRM